VLYGGKLHKAMATGNFEFLCVCGKIIILLYDMMFIYCNWVSTWLQ